MRETFTVETVLFSEGVLLGGKRLLSTPGFNSFEEAKTFAVQFVAANHSRLPGAQIEFQIVGRTVRA